MIAIRKLVFSDIKDFPFKDGDIVYGSGFEVSKGFKPTKYIAAKRGRLSINCSDFTLLTEDGKDIRTVNAYNMWFSDDEEEAIEKYNDLVFMFSSQIDDKIEELKSKQEILVNDFLEVRGYD